MLRFWRTIEIGTCYLHHPHPESLLTDMKWRDMLQSSIYQDNLEAFVVDEAHRVIKWMFFNMLFFCQLT